MNPGGNPIDDPIKPPDSHRWLVSYADYMTLLCAFFIMLYALELIDSRDSDAIKAEIQALFSQQSSTEHADDNPLSAQYSDQHLLEQGNGLLPFVRELQRSFQLSDPAADIEVDGEKDWLTVSLGADVLFAAGQTELSASGISAVQKLAAEIRDLPFAVTVQGHSDDTPGRELNNWQVSALRAASVVQALADAGVAPQRLAAVGLSYYHPRDDQLGEFSSVSDIDGESELQQRRARNRRVVISMTDNAQQAVWRRPRGDHH